MLRVVVQLSFNTRPTDSEEITTATRLHWWNPLCALEEGARVNISELSKFFVDDTAVSAVHVVVVVAGSAAVAVVVLAVAEGNKLAGCFCQWSHS